MTDIVERLRYPMLYEITGRDVQVIYARMREAADEIERLRASVKAWELIAKAPTDWKELPERTP
jgi:hypothetical protein